MTARPAFAFLRATPALRFAGILAAYLLLAWAGFSVAEGPVSPIWPAAGLSIAVLTLWGMRYWPAVAIAGFASTLFFAGGSVAAAAGVAFGYTLKAIAGALLLRRLGVGGEIGCIRDALAILGVAIFVPAISAAIGVVSLGLNGAIAWDDAYGLAINWWEGESIGILLLLPLVLGWFGTRASSRHVARPLELAGALAVTVALVSLLFFGSGIFARLGVISPPASAFLFPPVFWAILRLRPREAVLVLSLACALTATLTAILAVGPVAAPLVALQMMFLTVGGGSLVMLGAITERIATQAALQGNRELLSYALSAGHAGTFHWEAASNENIWSDELLALYGLRRERFGGRHEDWLATLVPEHRAAGQAAMEQSLRSGEFNHDFQIRRRDTGEKRWLAGRAKVYFDADGKPARMIGINQDITERKNAELALRASEAQLKAIFDHAPAGIAYLSLPERRFLRVNKAFCDMTGYSAEELSQLTSVGITLPEDRHAGQDEYARLADGRLESFAFEKRYVRKDGSTTWVRSVVSAIDGSGKTTYAINICEDVTREKLADEARREAEQRLKLAMEIAELGAWQYDVVADRLSIEAAWSRQLGLDEPELHETKEAWQGRIHPDDRDRVMDYLHNYSANPQGQYRAEYRFRVGDGSYRWLSSRAIAIMDDSGRLTRLVGAHLDITERKGIEQRIREESLHDPLTRLPNRALIIEYGGHVLGAARRSNGECAVLFVDLDRFKPINDLYGHEAGDAVLKETARRLRGCTRQEDLVGRLGGDEFVIVLSRLDRHRERIDTVARHVLEAVSRPIMVGALELSVSPSIGVACFPQHAQQMEELIQLADMAMYRAKQEGRADYRTYSPELRKEPDKRLAWKSRVKKALQQGDLVLHYQPITSLRDGRLVAAEALVRMVTPDGKTVGAYSFVPAAEASELGAQLDEWVLTAACRQHAEWKRQGLAPIVISVNISAKQFKQPAFAGKLRRIVDESGMDAAQLQIEVSGSLIEDAETTELFRSLKSVGVKIALDGFGTGLVSLPQLSSLPISCIKMEQSLVRGIGGDSSIRGVPELVIALGRILKFDVVGEGIESEEMLRSVRESGCDEAQGFYLCRPLPADDFAHWFRQNRRLH